MRQFVMTAVFGWLVCQTAGAQSPVTFTVTVENPSAHARTAQPVVVSLADRAEWHAAVSAVVLAGGREIPSQLDDLDADAEADELAFTVDVPAGGKTVCDVTLYFDRVQEPYAPGTHAYIKLFDAKGKHPKVISVTYPGDADLLDMYNSIYGHGAVFENGYIAYRVYMDNRQSIDLYGKTHPRLEMEETGFYTTDEQLAQGFGCDILWAGRSVGAGSFRGIRDGGPCYIDTVAWRRQTVVADGPVRSIVDVADGRWMYHGHVLDMSQRYTLYAGRRDLSVEVRIAGAPADETFCTGIQKLESQSTGFIRPDGTAGSWGCNVPEKSAPDHSEWVGLGLYVSPENRKEVLEDEFNYLNLLRMDAGGCIRYRVAVCAGREEQGFKSAAQWFDYLKLWTEECAQPCRITLSAHP